MEKHLSFNLPLIPCVQQSGQIINQESMFFVARVAINSQWPVCIEVTNCVAHDRVRGTALGLQILK